MKRTWTADELLEHFTLLPDELTAVSNKSGATELGFAVLFKCLQYEGRFPRSRSEVAPDVVRFLAVQGVLMPLSLPSMTGRANYRSPSGADPWDDQDA